MLGVCAAEMIVARKRGIEPEELSREAPARCSGHCRRANRRKKLCKDLLKASHRAPGCAEAALRQIPCNEEAACLPGQLQHYAELMRRVIEQTERRMLRDEKAAARGKLHSIFEERTEHHQEGPARPGLWALCDFAAWRETPLSTPMLN